MGIPSPSNSSPNTPCLLLVFGKNNSKRRKNICFDKLAIQRQFCEQEIRRQNSREHVLIYKVKTNVIFMTRRT